MSRIGNLSACCWAIVFSLFMVSESVAQDKSAAPNVSPEKQKLYDLFEKKLSNVQFKGNFTVLGREQKGDLPKEFRGYEKDSTEVYKSEKSQHGFIAQEVKAAIDKHSNIKDGFSMWDDNDETGQQRVGETALIPMLTKAVQELSAKVEELESKLNGE